MEEEVWRPIEGYENYQVSNLGRVRSLNYRHTGETRVLKVRKDKGGYLQVGLYKNGKIKSCTVHRLVAEAFIKNDENKSCIDHINTIRTDNRVENLKWVSHKENSNNEFTRQHLSEGQKGRVFSEERRRKIRTSQPNSKKVEISKNGISLGIFHSIRELERQSEELFETKLFNSNISLVCAGRKSHYKGFQFRYVD